MRPCARGEPNMWCPRETVHLVGALSFSGVRGKSVEIIVTNGEGDLEDKNHPAEARGRTAAGVECRARQDVPSEQEGQAGKVDDVQVAIEMREDESEIEKQAPGKEVAPRNFYISAKDLEDHGFSSKCPGCLSILRGKTRQARPAARRKSFESAFAGSDKVKHADYKITEHLAKMLERERDQQKIKRAKISNKEPEDSDVNISVRGEHKDVAM